MTGTSSGARSQSGAKNLKTLLGQDPSQSFEKRLSEEGAHITSPRKQLAEDDFRPVPRTEHDTEAARSGFTLVEGVDASALSRAALEDLAELAVNTPQEEPKLVKAVKEARDNPLRNWKLLVSPKTGVFTLKAARSFNSGQVVAVAGGMLYTQQQWERLCEGGDCDEQQLWAFDIIADDIKNHAKELRQRKAGPGQEQPLKKYTYKGKDLVLSQMTRSNFTRYIQDAKWWGAGRQNNLESTLFFMHSTMTNKASQKQEEVVVPHIVFTATRALKAGDELLLDYGSDCWLAFSRIQIMRKAHTTWTLHLLQQSLSHACLEHRIDPVAVLEQQAEPSSLDLSAKSQLSDMQPTHQDESLTNQQAPSQATEAGAAPAQGAQPCLNSKAEAEPEAQKAVESGNTAAAPQSSQQAPAPQPQTSSVTAPCSMALVKPDAAVLGTPKTRQQSLAADTAVPFPTSTLSSQLTPRRQRKSVQGTTEPAGPAKDVGSYLPPGPSESALAATKHLWAVQRRKRQRDNIKADPDGPPVKRERTSPSHPSAGNCTHGSHPTSAPAIHGDYLLRRSPRLHDGETDSQQDVATFIKVEPDSPAQGTNMQQGHAGPSCPQPASDVTQPVAAAESGGSDEVVIDDGVAVLSEGVVRRHVFSGLQHGTTCSLPHQVVTALKRHTARELLTKEERNAIHKGTAPKCDVVEILRMDHPVRWCTPPNERAFGLAANQHIRADEPICAYHGTLRTERDFKEVYEGPGQRPEDQGYAFEMTRQLLAEVMQHKTKGTMESCMPALVVESKLVGNEARFINCGFGSEQEKKVTNCKARVVFDNATHLPYVVIYATRHILPTEEIVADYGSEYWLIMARHLQAEHYRVFRKQRRACEALARALVEGGHMTRSQIAAAYDEAHLKVNAHAKYPGYEPLM